MLARVLAMALCLSVCLSVCLSQIGVLKTAERIELGFGTGASFHPSYSALTENSAISKNKGRSTLELCPKLRTKKILLRYIDRRKVLST